MKNPQRTTMTQEDTQNEITKCSDHDHSGVEQMDSYGREGEKEKSGEREHTESQRERQSDD